jgi:hypothetical protein
MGRVVDETVGSEADGGTRDEPAAAAGVRTPMASARFERLAWRRRSTTDDQPDRAGSSSAGRRGLPNVDGALDVMHEVAEFVTLENVGNLSWRGVIADELRGGIETEHRSME